MGLLKLKLKLQGARSSPITGNAMELRSGAALDTTRMDVGWETFVSRRCLRTAALVFAPKIATRKLRTGATWGWTATTAGWATGARTRALVDALQVLASMTMLAMTMALALPVTLNLTPRSATALRSTATLVRPGKGAGWETTVSPRLSRMVARGCVLRAATGTTRTGATWVLIPTDAGWGTTVRTSPKVAALMSSAQEEPWRRRKLWITIKSLGQAPTWAQAPTKDHSKTAKNIYCALSNQTSPQAQCQK